MTELKPRQVKQLINKWRKILQIEPYWQIDFEIRNSPADMSSGNDDASACIHVDVSYFLASIEINSVLVNEDNLESIILHELLHVILHPLSLSSACGLGDDYKDINDMLCENAIERLMPGYLYLHDKAAKKGRKRK